MKEEKKDESVEKWLKEIDLASSHEKDWRERAEKIVKRYRDDDRKDDVAKTSRFNVLYANTEVLKGIMYQKTPVPDVRRRFLDKNPIARQAAQILQRALAYSIDSYDFDAVMEAIVLDLLLPGRGVAAVKYVPTMGKEPMMDAQGQPVMGDDGKPMFPKVYEEVRCDYFEWDMFRMKPAKRWSKVSWVAFGELYTRDDLIRAFGDKGKACTLNWKAKEEEEKDESLKRALVWAIWDKKAKKVRFVSKGYVEGYLLEVDDPLGLDGFFPCPKPVYAIYSTTSLIPVPEFIQYQDQAIELDTITERIDALVDQLRFRGVQDASKEELSKLAQCQDGEFVPIENLAAFMEAGGLDKMIMTAPLDTLAKVLLGLYDQRDRVLQIIYQITGLSDIVRGSTQASETATAQELKGRYANVRVGPRQKCIAKFARDIFRIKAEIISEKYDSETLKMMTGPDLWVVDQRMPNPQNPQQMVTQKMDATQQIMELLRNDKLRGFSVDIETDSTVQPDASEEQKNRIEFLTAVSGFVTGIGPAVASGAIPKDVALEFLSFGARGFKVSPQLEDAIDRIGQKDDNAQQDPQQQQAQQMQQEQQQAQRGMMQADIKIKEADILKAEAEVREAQARAMEAEARVKEAVAKAMMAERQLSMPMPQEVVQ